MNQASLLEKESIEDFIALTFSGEATKKHTMGVKWYAQSLMGFNESFIQLNRELFGFEVTLEIVAEEQGSLLAKLKFVGSRLFVGAGLYASFATIDTYHDYKPSAAIKSAYVHVIEMFKESKGDPQLLEKMLDDERLNDEERKRLKNLIDKFDFKLSLDDMTRFLEQEGLDEVKIDGGEVKTSITQFDRPSFKIHPEDLKSVEKIDDVLTVVAIGNNQEWRFQGQEISKKFSAKILDNDFLQTIKLHPAKEIFKMEFEAKVVKTSIIKAGNRKPSPPIYEIDSLKAVNSSRPLPVE